MPGAGEKRCLNPGGLHSTTSFSLEKHLVIKMRRALQHCREGTECGKNIKNNKGSETVREGEHFKIYIEKCLILQSQMSHFRSDLKHVDSM